MKKDELLKKVQDFLRTEKSDAATASYCAIDEEGEVKFIKNGPCHSQLRDMDRVKGAARWVFLNTWIGRKDTRKSKETRKLFDKYANYLFFESPMSEYIVNPNLEDVLKNGLTIDLTTGIRSNWAAFICVAARTSYELPELWHVHVWNKLVENGIDPWVSLALTGRIRSLTKEEHQGRTFYTIQRQHFSGHHPFAQAFNRSQLCNLVRKPAFAETDVNKRLAADDLEYDGMSCAVLGEKNSDGSCELAKIVAASSREIEVGGRDYNNKNPWGSHPPVKKIDTLNFDLLKEELEKCL